MAVSCFQSDITALQPPPHVPPYWETHPPVGDKKNTLASLPADAPLCYVVPGNHDWFDGLASYMRYVLGREYLGGRFMPQQKSYFALELPHDWWVFGMDDGLDGEIDSQVRKLPPCFGQQNRLASKETNTFLQ